MKYSLRSLMIVVTLACVIMGRMAYVRNMAATEEAAAERIVEDLAKQRLVFYPHSDSPTADRINRDINAMAHASGPLYVVDRSGELCLRTEGVLWCVLRFETPEAIEEALAAIQYERSALAYREAIWRPWRLSIQPSPMQVVRKTAP